LEKSVDEKLVKNKGPKGAKTFLYYEKRASIFVIYGKKSEKKNPKSQKDKGGGGTTGIWNVT